jgi:hypothetical protein
MGTECKSANGANAGCAFSDTQDISAGSGFNKVNNVFEALCPY